ncbi:hypothetical protein Trydic_g14594 [Trypoxylus dichotomus]
MVLHVKQSKARFHVLASALDSQGVDGAVPKMVLDMYAINYLVIVMLALVVLSESLDGLDDAKIIQECGIKLSEKIQKICNSRYYGHHAKDRHYYRRRNKNRFLAHFLEEAPLNLAQRLANEYSLFRRNVSDECCKTWCTVGHMYAINYLAIAMLALAVLSESHVDLTGPDDTGIQACGSYLTIIVKVVCNSSYAKDRHYYRRYLEEEAPLNLAQRLANGDGLFRRQLHDECCEMKCTLGHIRTYYCRL